MKKIAALLVWLLTVMASAQGDLKTELEKLRGTWTQGGSSLPLVLERSM